MNVCYSNCGLLSTYGVINILQIRTSHSHFRCALSTVKNFVCARYNFHSLFVIKFSWIEIMQKKWYHCDRTRTCNPRVRCPMPYPLGHTTWYELSCTSEDFILCSGMVKWIKKCILHIYFTIVAVSWQVTHSMKLISCYLSKSYCYVKDAHCKNDLIRLRTL